MSLQRVDKIRRYGKRCNSHFLLLPSVVQSLRTVPRGFHSETVIQKNNLIFSRNGVYQKSPYIDSLCKSFELSSATNFSPFGSLKKKKEKESTPTPASQPCKKCAKIRNSVKKFFRAKFETENAEKQTTNTSLTEQHNQIRMHIFKSESDHVNVVESHNNQHAALVESHQNHHAAISESHANKTVCFGCEQPKREPADRGQPIISPVCNGQVSASPLGEVFKNLPERVKKVVKIDRPQSLGPRKRITDKEQSRETSVHETQKPSGR